MTSSPEQRQNLYQHQDKAENNRDGQASLRTKRVTGLAFGQPQVEECVDYPEKEEHPNQQTIEGARLQPPDPAPPAGARFHWLQGSHVGREANQPRE
jgi:hypothetical protein